MNSFPKFGFVFVLIFSSFALSCCKDECKVQTATSADFKIYEALGWDIKVTEVANSDTAVATSITFEASDSSSEVRSYEWMIGSDNRTFKSKNVTLEFDSRAVNSWVSVRLIVKKDVNKMCFPDDDGVDTIVKRFFVVNKSLASGKFEGYCKSNPTEKFSIFIGVTPDSDGDLTIDNIPNGCTRKGSIDSHLFEPSANYRCIIFGRPNFKTDGKLNPLRCQIPWGKGKVQPDGVTLIMDYQIWDPSKNQFVNDQFIGIKK